MNSAISLPALHNTMNITLIGMAGAGKSYTGKALARKLGYSFIDIDIVIEKKLKKKLHDVVCSIGDRGFVKLEEKTILALKNPKNTVISPGGSVVYSKKAIEHLRKAGPVVFLKTFLGYQKACSRYERKGAY